ncbi:MAG TPA: hypothetical protein DCY12_11440 [Candidatus Atribacteria bacterium]|nr:hypothetical protein [Candidatus Atribacteria bacterium]
MYVIIHSIKEIIHIGYIMESISGLGKEDRKKLAALLRKTKGTISVQEASAILNTSNVKTAKLLSRWAEKGWLSRIKRGLYVPIPLESPTIEIALEDPWIIADRLYSPCYFGGWSAAEYWSLTEQTFRTVIVMTTKKPRNRTPNIKGTPFSLKTISEKTFFGTKSVWRGQIKLSVSDPSRTILDMLDNPQLGGGIRSVVDMLSNYFNSEYRNLKLLIEYAIRLNNGAVFKRLGFLLERLAPDQVSLINICKKNLTLGNAKLDPQLTSEKLITRWRLWVPKSWVEV